MLRHDLKRKRRDVAAGNVVAVYRARPRTTKRRRMFVPGQDRVGGYYGRFSGAGGEHKFHDLNVDDAIVAAAGFIEPSCNIIAQDVTESTRVGRKATIKLISWRGQVTLPIQDAVANVLTGVTCRVILYLDKQANGAAPAVLDILETAVPHSFYNLANRTRFSILSDRQYALSYSSAGSDGAGLMSMNGVVREWIVTKKCSIPIEWDNTANTGAIATIRSNNIGVCLVAQGGTVGVASSMRVRFTDS